MMKGKRKIGLLLGILVLLIIVNLPLNAQTTGKIFGTVTDETSSDPLPGANVIIVDSNRGAACDLNGDFYILNITPGVYSLRIQMMGYETLIIENLRVSVNRTSNVVAKMKPAVIMGQEIIVQADKVAVKKDQTSSIRNVSSKDIEMLPVENVGAVIAMQPGVVAGHFRGGRSNEVAYLVDGIEVTEAFGGGGRTVDLEPEAIQDLEVITGTFNAEYGNAMSGVVNAVTKDGAKQFHGAVSADFANFFTPHKDIFIGLKDSDFNRNQDYKFQLSGPIWKNKLTFFANIRYQDNRNHLNGIRRFNPDDYSYFLDDDPSLWYSEHNGDSAYVSMNGSENLSFLGKLTAKPFNNFRLSFLYTRNDDRWDGYSHVYKYNPDGRASGYRETDMYSVSLNHLISPKLFYEFKLSYNNNYNGNYLFENPLDEDYLHDVYSNIAGPGFFTGGQEKGHNARTMKDYSTNFSLNWQINKNHSIKTGLSSTHHDLDNQYSTIRNEYADTDLENEFYFDFERQKLIYPNYKPKTFPDSTIYSDIYRVKPKEYSAYLQDKIEFNEMVLNVGLRYDYFDPNTVYPSQPRNPANQLLFSGDSVSTYPKADPNIQLSPRFGLAYQLGASALLHFSYGHFFQMPPMYALYQNHSFRIPPTDYTSTLGNSQIKAQKTVQYEIGLWQEVMEGMGVEVALFYRDIYDLLSAKVISTYNQIEYGLYSNKDYGNAKGLEIKYDFIWNNLSAFVNYTLQYTRGNADNPTQTFTRAGDSRDPISRLIPMSWDQRHTFNVTVGYNTASYGATLTGYYNSGTPYTWSPVSESILARVNLYPNNNWRPSNYSIDLNSFYQLDLMNKFKLKFTLSIYNLVDRLNEYGVNGQTGRAYTAIIRQTDLLSHRSDFNEYIDRIQNPGMYSAPRMIKVGMGLVF